MRSEYIQFRRDWNDVGQNILFENYKNNEPSYISLNNLDDTLITKGYYKIRKIFQWSNGNCIVIFKQVKHVGQL